MGRATYFEFILIDRCDIEEMYLQTPVLLKRGIQRLKNTKASYIGDMEVSYIRNKHPI